MADFHADTLASDVWIVWIAVSVGTFLVIEFGSILLRRYLTGTWRHAAEWTLSECIRRWSAVHHWLPVLAVGGMAALAAHLFLVPSP